MAQNLDEKRKQLYNIIKKGNPDYERKSFDLNFSTQKAFESFVATILKNKKEKPKTHWDLIKVKDLASFYRTFACDLEWAKKNTYCGSIQDDVNTAGFVGIQTYEGTYTTSVPAIKKVRVYKGKDENDEESLYLSSIYLEKIPQLKNYIISKLTPNKNNPLIFSISNKSGEELVDAITFSSNKFVFKYSILGKSFEITATKEDPKVSDEVTPPTPVKTKTDNTIVKKDKDDEIPVVRSKPLYFDTDKKDDTPSKDCGDFPFTLGCINSKIGDLNAKLFRGDRKNNKYIKRLQNLLNNSANFNSSNPNMEITKDLWDELMNKQVIKESVKKVLKEYINKKK